jgi:outer membrane protein W
MKKVVLLLAVLLTAFANVNAQKSSKFVTGTVSYSKTTDVDASYSVSPTIGYYVTDRVSVGVTGEIGKAGAAKTTNIGVFGRCDFMNIGKSCQVFSQLDLVSNSSTVADVKTTSTSANLGLGGNYHINKKWALTMHVADLISYESADGNSTTTIGFSGINNPFATAKFGVVYKF